VNKFLFTVDRDPELVERYRADPAGTVAWWEAERANQILNCVAGSVDLAGVHGRRACGAGRAGSRCALPEDRDFPFSRDALDRHVRTRSQGPLAMQLDYAAKLKHFALPYPDIGT
jgi:hypothetical protein